VKPNFTFIAIPPGCERRLAEFAFIAFLQGNF
jgi:hypothetical protein